MTPINLDKLLLNINRVVTAFIMTLEDKDIIQVDASVIAGVLVFLTLTNVSGFKTPSFQIQSLFTLLVIVPFSISAILILLDNLKPRPKLKNIALLVMVGGFIYLIFAVAVLFVGSFNIHK
jgi:hypothetical protein